VPRNSQAASRRSARGRFCYSMWRRRFALAASAAGRFTRSRFAARITASLAGRTTGPQPGKQATAGLAARIRLAAGRLTGGWLAARRRAGGRFAARITASLAGRTTGLQAGKQTTTGLAAGIRFATSGLTGGRLTTGWFTAGGLAAAIAKSAKKAGFGVRRGDCEKHRTGDQCREDDTTLHGRYSLLGKTKWTTYLFQTDSPDRGDVSVRGRRLLAPVEPFPRSRETI
jgi:hypothetical protein